jgi:hypothetical protein
MATGLSAAEVLACAIVLPTCPGFERADRRALAIFVGYAAAVDIRDTCTPMQDDAEDCMTGGTAEIVVQKVLKGRIRADARYTLPVSSGDGAQYGGCHWGHVPRRGDRVIVHVVKSPHDGQVRYQVGSFEAYAAQHVMCSR